MADVKARLPQVVAVVVAVAFVAALHASNDGLWFQGDAPRHAVNGLFVWDWLRSLPSSSVWSPIAYAIRYYARYPVIAPATYPPLFYLLEGAAFQILGPSGELAKALILAFTAVTAVYTMGWARRWIGPAWGWAGAFVPLLPGVVMWSNVVMLNVPAMALSVACLYHVRRWLESREPRQLAFAVAFLIAGLLTYYQTAVIALVCAIWLVLLDPRSRLGWRQLSILGAGALLALVPLLFAIYIAPVQLTRHLPSVERLMRLDTWTFYPALLPQVTGFVALTLGAIGLAAGWSDPRWRHEAAFLTTWIAAILLSFTLLPARDVRYILTVAPAFVVAVAMALRTASERFPADARWRGILLTACAIAGLAIASRVSVPHATGLREIADFLDRRAPREAVLYDGFYDGVLGFYLRARDPLFERRMVRGGSLLYHYGQTRSFRWVETSELKTADEVVKALRERCGCPWIAVEIGPLARQAKTARLLRQTVERPDFELVQSFPVDAPWASRVDLYHLRGPIAEVTSFDLSFPSFSDRIFENVAPVVR